ncbi:ion transporter [Myceligenerans indicum]|uniref:Ion transporter n=1 Tax=Myceligenerans indicum TaxID=2593663 RepID=A0ABS1LKH3_9MICO|nr:ion transporter [Myceligenerans indicum]MBL0886711.1 ion transporter [Myceligenerans indicum]
MRDLVEATWFSRAVLMVIVANALVLGVETSIADPTVDLWLRRVDTVMLWIFVVELCLRIFAHGRKFFTDPWSIFDLLVVGIALVPASVDSLSALRALRILRALRVVNAVPSMKRVVNGLVAAVPGMGSVGALLMLVLYVSAVIATKLFRDIAPGYFGNLGTTLFSLFQVMTGEAWPDIADAVMAEMPGAWIFFVLFILIVSFAVLNLFIAVIVSGMESLEEELVEHDKEDDASNAALLTEIRAIRTELATLRAERDGVPSHLDTSAGGAN